MPQTRAVYNGDWELLKIQHTEAFGMVSYPITLLRFTSSVSSDLYEETSQKTFTPIVVSGIFDPEVTAEKLKVFGNIERADATAYFSLILLERSSLTIDNRDRVRYNSVDYDIISFRKDNDMGDRRLECQVALRAVR